MGQEAETRGGRRTVLGQGSASNTSRFNYSCHLCTYLRVIHPSFEEIKKEIHVFCLGVWGRAVRKALGRAELVKIPASLLSIRQSCM